MLDPEILSATSSILRPLKFLHSCAKHHARTVLSCVDFDIFYFELLDPEILTNDTQDKVSRKIRTTTRYVRIFFAEECRKLKKNNTKDTDDRQEFFFELVTLVVKGNAALFNAQGISILIVIAIRPSTRSMNCNVDYSSAFQTEEKHGNEGKLYRMHKV